MLRRVPALLALAVDGSRRVVLAALHDDPVWSARAGPPKGTADYRPLSDEAVLRLDLEDALRMDWDHLHIVPVDQRCLDRDAGHAREQQVRLTSAIHLPPSRGCPRQFAS